MPVLAPLEEAFVPLVIPILSHLSLARTFQLLSCSASSPWQRVGRGNIARLRFHFVPPHLRQDL